VIGDEDKPEMKVSVEELSLCKRAILVEVPLERVCSKMEEAYRSLSRTLVLPGFRKGRVPRSLIERRFRDELKSEVVKELVSETCLQAIKAANLTPVSEPKVEEVSFENGQPFRFRATFEIKPSIQLGSYKGVDVFKDRITVSEEETERALHLLREGAAEYVPMEGWPALHDDLVVIDYEGFVGGKSFKGGKGENINLILGSREFIPGFEEQLYGLQKGETKAFSLELPLNHPWRELAGKKVLFKVTVKEIKKKRIPSLDDDFARAIGGCENLKELREKVRAELLKRKEQGQEERLKEKILEKIVHAHPFEPPESLVEAEAEVLLSSALSSLPADKDPDEEVEALRPRLREIAEQRVKASLLLEAIASAEGLKVGEEELDQELKVLAASLNQDQRALKAYLSKEGRLQEVGARLLRRKALDLLYQNARITEAMNVVTLA